MTRSVATLKAIAMALCLIVLVAQAGSARAQVAEQPTILRGQLEPIPRSIITGDMTSKETADALYKECRSFYPSRFTPTALDSYCECAVTATQLSISAKEFQELQAKRNQKITNPTYQKYITTVIAPCMDAPTVEIEYMSCVLDKFADSRVYHFPRYCQCVAREVRDHVQLYGDVDILITMSANQKITNPMEALWSSPKYRQSVRNAKDSCMSINRKPKIKYSNE